MNQIQYIKWLNSKGHTAVKVNCKGCGKEDEAIIEKADRKRALKNDSFFCIDCSRKMLGKEFEKLIGREM